MVKIYLYFCVFLLCLQFAVCLISFFFEKSLSCLHALEYVQEEYTHLFYEPLLQKARLMKNKKSRWHAVYGYRDMLQQF